MRQIADRAGVSTCTVSKILSGGSGHERYSDECRKRVEAAARALGFVPNHAARALRTGATGIIAFAISWPASSNAGFEAAMIAACEGAALERGHRLLMVGAHRGRSAAALAAETARSRQCDGIVIPGLGLAGDDLTALRRCSVPVSFWGTVPGPKLRGCELDDGAGVAAAVEHLADLGHRRVAWIDLGGAAHVEERRRAAVTAATARTLDLRCIRLSGYPRPLADETAITHARAELLQRRAEYADRSALVCYHDLLALGAYAALRELGREVPRDVSVVGFDNVHAATALPALTTIDHELEALAEAAIELLSTKAPEIRRIPPRLVVRASTAPPP
jgi:DNA-binding LacI/PurR family transcriptional regulator